jgi:hypothetical protein
VRNKDAEILYFVREFRFVTERHLSDLTGRQTLWRRLPVLVGQKKLYRRKRGVYQPHVYAAYNITNRKDFDHDLMITDIHVALHKSGKLLTWVQPKEKLKGELNEDAYCVLSVASKKLHCFIEADNSSEPDWQIREKVERYLSHQYGTQNVFRVLFVAPDSRRVKDLLRASQRAIPNNVSRVFLFTALPDFKKDCVGRICSICHDDNAVSLVPSEAR